MMAYYKSRQSKQSFSDYLKLGLGLNITKECLHGLVKEETTNFHKAILQEIHENQLCSECRIENILECPTNGLCSPNHCTFHNSSLKQPRQCPSGSCNIFRDKIRKNFRCYESDILEPSWSNTDAQKWVLNAFQVIKCFLPPGDYEDADVLEDVDLRGLLSIIINKKGFERIISDNLDKKDNICIQVLGIESTHRNSDSLTVSEWQLSSHLDLLINLLTGIEHVVHNQKVKQCVVKLKQLKSNTLIVNTNTVTDILSKSIHSVEKENEEKRLSRGKSKQGRLQHSAIRKLKLNVLYGCQDIFLNEKRKIKTSHLGTLISEQGDAIRHLKENTMRLKELEDKETGIGVTMRKRPKPPEINDLTPSRISSTIELSYEELKSKLKQDLIQFYRERHSTLPLSPLIQKNKAPLLDFYVQPEITVVDLEKGLFDEKEHLMYKDVNSLGDAFQKKENEFCRNICLTAPPGAGKTTFIKYLAMAWCEAQNEETSKDREYMKRFAFVFVIPLRDARQECEQDDMLSSLVISQLDQQYLYSNAFLQEILHREQCLVLMDGLDEWQHPKQSIKHCHKGKSSFPHTKVRPQCINFSTTRPWALNSTRICDYFDHRLEIQGLGKESSKKLVGKVLCHLTGQRTITNQTESENKKDLFFDMLSLNRLQKFESNPIILMQLLCLWFEGTEIGDSQCEIYSNMLELLFRRAELTKTFRTKGKNKTKLPDCFTRNTRCKRYAKILHSLGKLAFATLFSEKGESLYVFDRRNASELMSDQNIQRCLEVGILFQNEKQGKITTENIKLSFLHKTFQEFFAALFISAKPEKIKEVEKKMLDYEDPLRTSLQLEVLLIFISGFAPNITSDFTTRLGKAVASSYVTKEYRENIGTLFLESRCPVVEHSYMITKCVMESICNGHQELNAFYLEDICIDEQCVDMNYATALKRLIQMNQKRIKSLSILVMQTIDKTNVNRILHELNIQSICNLEKLYVWGDIPKVHLQSLLQLSKYTANCLELWGMHLYSEDVISITKMDKIERISFLSTPMKHNVLESLMSNLNQRKHLSQLCFNDIECVDHLDGCTGYSLNLPKQSRLVLLLLDKVPLSRISFNGEQIKMCVVEWLPVPGVLKSLLDCLSNSETLERFDYDGSATPNEIKHLVQTISSMQKLRHLRLRNVDLRENPLDIERVNTLRTVYFCNVSIDSDVLHKIIEQMECFPAHVIFCMDYCEVTPWRSYQQLLQQLRSSKAIEVLLDNAKGFKQLHIKTIPSDKTLRIAQRTDQETADWKQCFYADTNFARKVADRLIKVHEFPEQQTLDKLCNRFGLKDELITSLCTEIGTYIQKKSEKIVQVIPSYQIEDSSSYKIIFIVCTNGSLSRKETLSITYTHKIRPLGVYSLEGKDVAKSKILIEQKLSSKELENLKKCINKHAETLMSKHKLLSIILPSPVRSQHYEKFGKVHLTREPCIVLFVHTKNYIPINEEPFEKFYEGIPVDVREGGFVTHPTEPFNGDLTMGCSIGSAISNTAGTLGGFIEHPTYGLCGLTCAHVLLHDQRMDDLLQNGYINWPHFYPYEGVTQPGGSTNVIGRLVQATYSKGSDDQSGIEIALFQIEGQHPNTGNFHGNVDMRFDCGKCHGFSRITDTPVIKHGCTTHATAGRFVMNEPAISVRTCSPDIEAGTHVLKLHNQLAVMPLELGPLSQDKFADFGDSGSLVFMKTSQRDNEYICVGMVEGGLSSGETIVTPILPILQACGVDSFKSFETARLSEELKNVKTEITNKIQSLESRVDQLGNNLEKIGSSIMTKLNNITLGNPS